MSKYMIVISFDAVSSQDLKILKTLPNFKKIIDNGSLIKDVESVYPTLTYPAHATIVTGKYPGNHGIIDNTKFKLGDLNPNWYWYRKDIKGKTLYDLAKEKGLTTCSLLWPVTGRSSIDYNMPEIFGTKPYHNQMLMSATAGSIGFQLDINKRFGYIRKGITQPALDDFVMEAAKHTIDKYMPNLIFIHLTDVDTHRHHCGYNCDKVMEAMKRHDKRLGEILEILDNKGILEETSIIALGDHSQLDGNKIVKINKLFKDNGLININKSGKIVSYKAICKSLDGAAYIYLNDEIERDNVRELLSKYTSEIEGPIEFILNKKEATNRGADRNCEFMIEALKGYYFVDDIDGDFIEEINEEEVGVVNHRHKATHGYFPTKDNYGTFFIAYGNEFKKGFVKEGGKLINHGPTMAKALGLELEDCDGVIEEEIFL